MADPAGVPPFKQFLDSVRASKHEAFSRQTVSLVAHEDAFTERELIFLRLYEHAEVQHSFVDANGSIFDCIPIEQQPSLRGSTASVPKAPDLPHHEQKAGTDHERKPTSSPPQWATIARTIMGM